MTSQNSEDDPNTTQDTGKSPEDLLDLWSAPITPKILI